VYTGERIVQILAKDGTSLSVQIDPQAQQAYHEELDQDNKVIARILNPKIGKYMVEADVGPAYATQRQEGFNALVQILSQAPDLAPVVMDILMSNGDFPGAEEAAMRLKRMVPPQALGTGPTQAEQQMQQQITQLQQGLAKTFDELVMTKVKLKGKDQLRDVDVYKAETDRIKALGDAMGMDPQGVQELIGQLVREALQTSLQPVLDSTQPGLDARQGLGGADAGDLSKQLPPVPGPGHVAGGPVQGQGVPAAGGQTGNVGMPGGMPGQA
jgi:hypothetical protein